MSPSALFGERSPTFCRRRGPAAWVMVWMCVALGMSVGRPVLVKAQTESVLVNFTGTLGAAPGQYPTTGSLIQASDGYFYGTTELGGANNTGTFFRINPVGAFTSVLPFSAAITSGMAPYVNVVQGADGDFYGTTLGISGNNGNAGTLFKITAVGNFTLLYSFLIPTTNGSLPYGQLTQGTDGNFYGTTGLGGANGRGAIYKITPSGVFSLLHSFASLTIDGSLPYAGLVQGADGDFYGTTSFGGANSSECYYGCGTVYKITPTGIFTVLHSFSAATTDGSLPYGGLIQGSDGNFYGTTYAGGAGNCSSSFANGCGTIFKITPTGNFTLLYSFSGTTDGANPWDGLVLGTDGNFYGTAEGGGTNSYGTVFNLSPAGTLTMLHNFANSTTDGSRPQGGLAQGADGNFYGTTTSGGSTGNGTIFKLTPATPLPGPVQLTVPSSVTAGAPFTLGYSVYNAYSATLQQCFATNNAGVADWTGIYTSSPSTATAYLTAPTTTGTYTYALTCGGMESGFATLNVAPATTYNPTTFSVSAVSAPFGSTAGVTVTATEAGTAGPVTGGVVTFSVLSPATGSFSPTICTLTAAGTCTTTYIPTGTLGVNTYSNDIQANFAANNAYNPATANNTLTITPAQLTEPVNSTSSGQIATLTLTASGTLGAINVLTLGAPNLDFKQTGGGTINHQPCTVGNTYNAGDTCAVFYTFTPSHPGIRYGGITLSTTSGTLLGNTYISGIGTGPQITWSPDQQAVLDNGLNDPRGMTVDGNGNTYVAQNSSLVQISAAGAIRNIPFSGDLQDVAVDGSGNVFVANASYAFQEVVNEIVAVNGSIPATPEIRTFTGFGTVWAVAVDRNGNLFVTQSYSTGNDCALYELPAVNGSIPATPTILTVATTFGVSPCDPYGIAFDAGGNLFVADPQASAIYELLAVNGTIPASPTIRTVESGLIDPAYIALDAAGDIFAADFRSTVYEMLAVNGTVPSTNPTILKLGSGLKIPAGVAIDGSGNVFISDVGLNQIFKLDYADPPTLTFATTPVGQASTDSPKTVTMSNDGNESLIYTVPSSGPNPTITPGFAVASNSTCPLLTSSSSGGTLPAGAFCNYSVSFMPIAGGLDSGFLIPTDNNLNIVNATQKVPLNGTGTGATLAPTVISISPHSGPTTGGTTITITGTNFTAVTAVDFGALAATSFIVNSATQITAVSPAAPVSTVDVTVTTPSGTSATSAADQFTYVDATQTITFPAPPGTAYAGTAVTLNASASSGLPVTYTVVSGPAYVTGSTLTYTAAGSVVVEADQAGNSSYGPATPVQITLKPVLLTEPVATASATIPTVVIFSAAGTLANINVLTQGAANLDFAAASGSTCAAGTTYAAGQTCTIDFIFTPTRPGLRYGGISLTDSSGDLLASSYVYGEGIGPMVTYSPGTESLVGSGLSEPSGVALDGNGDIFVSNNSGTTLTEIQVGTGTVVQIGSFVAGDDVAVDGNGNVFVASNRSTISEVMAVNGTVPASPVINTIASSFTAINGIKVDANGDVFVACSSSGGTNVGIYEIVAVNGTIPANPTILTLSTAFTGPTGIAIDASGDVFVSDELTGQLDEMLAVNGSIPANPTIVTVASGFNEPANVSLDGTGNVFVAEYGGQDVKEVLAVNGSIPANPTIVTLQPATPGGAIPGFGPEGLFIDGSGNVYVADAVSTGVVKMDFSDPPTLTFTDTYVGQTSTDSPQTVTTFNDGNAPLNYTVPGTGFNPAITAGFTVSNSSTCPQLSSSSSPATLAAGASCTNLVSFTPVAVGLDSGFLTTTDNALNVVNATQLVPLNGTGKVNPTPVVTLTGTPNPVFLLNPVTFTATVSSPAFQPTGSVTFLDGTTPLGTVALNGGVATLTTSTLAMGLHPITAVYTGPNFPSQTSPVLLELVEDFSLTITNPDVVIPHGGTAVYNLVVMTVGGTVTASTINFGIAGAPDHSLITFDPATVATGSGTTNITLTIKTPDYPVGPWSSIVRPPVVLALTAFGALLLPFSRRRRRALLARRLLVVAVLATFAMLSGCGSGWKTQHYSITVTASVGPLSHSAGATLTSKQ